MEKNKKPIIFLSVIAGVLALSLIALTLFLILRQKPQNDPEDSKNIETEEANTTETQEDTTDTEHIPALTTEAESTETYPPETTDAPQTSDGRFQEVNEQVTAKNEVNLRSSMDQGTDDNIVCSLVNGAIALRTGIAENGWSRVVYEGQTLYCVSSYLTTDLNYVPPAADTDGFKTQFTPVNEKVTAKEVTNLRDIPSVLEPSQVVVQLNHGEVAVRTGIANEGCSRVEYNGQVLYCISSYLELVEE